ncbi:hypothetical protein BOX15_Mlig021458g1, partial [Macrostomum lignano]
SIGQASSSSSSMALVPAYQGRLPQPVLPGLVAVGRFDGRSDTLVCAANSGKLMLLSPGQQQSGPVAMETDTGLPVQILNMEQPVLSMCAGRLLDSASRDALVIGTATDMLVYDVHRNADLFNRPVPDGAFAVVVSQSGDGSGGGEPGRQQQQKQGKTRRVAIAGGNCTLLGFDSSGAEAYWSVTGDRVTSMTAGKFLGDEAGELLLVGSEDFELRLFRDDAIAREFTETDSPVALLALPDSPRFAYALANGTVGVYERSKRLWRIKSKHRPVALAAFDLDSDGQVELLVGWSGGKVDARRVATGEVVFRDQGPSPVAGLAVADLRGDGRPPLLTIVGVEGDLRAFDAVPQHLAASLLRATLGEDAPGSMRSLMQYKQSLGLELRNYADQKKRGGAGGDGSDGGDGGMRRIGSGVNFEGTLRVAMGTAGAEASVIPANTQLSSSLSVEADAVVLSVSTSNETVVRALAVFAEGLFEEGESLVAHPPANQVSSQLALVIRPSRNAAVDLHLKCLVGQRGSVAQFHVFEASRLLPRFATFAWLGTADEAASAAEAPAGWVRFRLAERPQRLAMWINNSFLLPSKATAAAESGSFRFRCVRTGRLLSIETRSPAAEPMATVGVDSLELAAEVVASLADFLGLDDLASEASFPGLSEQLDGLASRVRQLEAGQARLAADQADSSGLVRSLAVRAEDSRLLGDMANTRQAYADLLRVNRGLVASHRARADAHASLVGALKQVGLVIQQGAALRTGRYRAQVVAQCRAAVQEREFGLIYQVICSGAA